MTIADVLEGRERWAVVQGDSRVVLASISDGSFDSCVCDPPYGLGTREPSVEELIRFLGGEDTLRTGGDFMGRSWQVPSVPLWREVLRVLKPGAHCLAFAGTRTVDLIMLGLRAAGFECRDCVSWVYGSGFPKSLDVSKAIDAELGAERVVVGPNPNCRPNMVGVEAAVLSPRVDAPITSPTTPEAVRYTGFGTALKPAHEFIIMARKPLGSTVAKCVLKHGTGGLNIDACRIGTDWSERSDAWKASGHSAKPEAEKIAAPAGQGIVCNPAGRWPANFALAHSDGCVRVGRGKVRGGAGTHCSHWPAPCRGHGDAGQCQSGETRHGAPPFGWSPSQTETVDTYACVPGCPVAELGRQSGESISAVAEGVTRYGRSAGIMGNVGALRDDRPEGHADSGTAARFFYTAKSSRSERELGCEHLPPRSRTDITGRDDDAPGQNNPRCGIQAVGGIRNTHPCVKPIDLLRWLSRLVTPPGGVLLDPFAGSGSGGCAAVAEGFRYVGIELDADGFDYCAIARARIAWWQAHPGGPTAEAKAETRREEHGQIPMFARKS